MLEQSIQALVISMLDYYNALYVGLLSKMAWKLLLVPKIVVILLSGACRSENITPILYPVIHQLHYLLPGPVQNADLKP